MRHSIKLTGVMAVAFALLSGCTDRHVAIGGTPLAGSIPQAWGAGEQIAWYRGSQGSRLIPETWLRALEDAGSQRLFLAPENFARFNYLPPAPGETATLPIGFAVDAHSSKNLPVTDIRWYKGQNAKQPWVGLNCAACHTAEIRVGTTSVRVDGAPTMGDFQRFTKALREAMDATLSDPAKWDRFAARVLPARKNAAAIEADRAMLKSSFGKLLAHQQLIESYNKTDSDYGYGRLDAVGHILNKVAFLNHSTAPIRGEPNAPVSYPFIWNAPQHQYVQWNGLVPNQDVKIGRGSLDAGALIRNTSEVIGVFADVKTRPKALLGGYRSSVYLANLQDMELQLGRLNSPKWPGSFGTLDMNAVAAGRVLFDQHCSSCHAHLASDDTTTMLIGDVAEAKTTRQRAAIASGQWRPLEMTQLWGDRTVDGHPIKPIGTDSAMACNTFSYKARGGILTDTVDITSLADSLTDPKRLPAIGPTADYLKIQAIGVLLGQKWEVIKIAARAALGTERGIQLFTGESASEPAEQPLSLEKRLALCEAEGRAAIGQGLGNNARRTLAYKARPLNGIWATAPYLHNGSVKSLFELLLAPADRDPEFWVGNHDFDPVNVGFVDQPGATAWLFQARRGKIGVFGNSNLGHDYGNAGFSNTQRLQLVEYMKSL